MTYRSINPFNGELLKSYGDISDRELEEKVLLARKAFELWSKTEIQYRLSFLPKLWEVLGQELKYHSSLISIEMGKPVSQSKAEIEKCISACKYYYQNSIVLLKPEKLVSYADESYVIYEPSGIIYGIMPWNFPYWQVLRYVIPNLVLGNTVFLKHASNVPQCAEAIESAMNKAGFPNGVFQNLFISYDQSDKLIANQYISGITFTGSEAAGSKVAELAGKHIKKSVLELGGSDPFIVLSDADINRVMESAVFARMQNAGQSCIAAKRFFVHENVFNEFIDKFSKKLKNLKQGDPLNEETEIGPLSSENILKELDEQVRKSISAGARLITGGKRQSAGSLFYDPTLIEASDINVPVCNEETFGPVAAAIKFTDVDEMIDMVNSSAFGLGASLWSKDIETARKLAGRIESGMVTINGMVKSDPALPFGGTKRSGFGRELASAGLKEFSNAKTITIHY
jgi:succinate-semialdehyde dehydrogenase/glutarate-semialdehyde dehydrogenase